MTKFVLTIETENLAALRQLLDHMAGPEPAAKVVAKSANAAKLNGPEPELEPAAAPAPPPQETPKPKGRPRKEAAPAPPASPATPQVPLKDLVVAVTDAVRKAQRGEADPEILNLLANFKEATGLDFVMNAEEQHKGALIDFLNAAKVPLPV